MAVSETVLPVGGAGLPRSRDAGQGAGSPGRLPSKAKRKMTAMLRRMYGAFCDVVLRFHFSSASTSTPRPVRWGSSLVQTDTLWNSASSASILAATAARAAVSPFCRTGSGRGGPSAAERWAGGRIVGSANGLLPGANKSKNECHERTGDITLQFNGIFPAQSTIISLPGHAGSRSASSATNLTTRRSTEPW